MRGTRTSGSEVRAGETDCRKRRHRAPARPYSLSWLHRFKRLRVRWEHRADIHEAFPKVACCLVCWRYLQA
jgi:hypothetical protein